MTREVAARPLGFVLVLAFAGFPFGDRLPLLDLFFKVGRNVHAAEMLGVEVLAVKDSPARKSRQARTVRVRNVGAIADRR